MSARRIKLTRDLAWAAAQDAGDASMRKAGRTHWSAEDYNVCVRTFERLWPEERDIELLRQKAAS